MFEVIKTANINFFASQKKNYFWNFSHLLEVLGFACSADMKTIQVLVLLTCITGAVLQTSEIITFFA